LFSDDDLCAAHCQQFNSRSLQSLHWRNIGPFRGGRVRAVAGVRSSQMFLYGTGQWRRVENN